MNIIELDGSKIESTDDLHRILKTHESFPNFYGQNLSALWDSLTGLVEMPTTINWINSGNSRSKFPKEFDKIVSLFREIEEYHSFAPGRFVFNLS